jgi:RNA polymerase sigma-70 factor (TIGR02960 family)
VTSSIDAARAGDEAAFRDLTQPHLHELHVHCYRMLGSIDDADDLVQETLIAAWQCLDAFEGRSSLRAWLYRIATNRCLNAIRDRKRRPPVAPTPPFDPPPPTRAVDVPWLQPYPDDRLQEGADPLSRYEARERIELAFVAALQMIPPRQTAALLLCDVIGFEVADVADMLDTSPTAIKGVLQRARASLASSVPPQSDARARVGAQKERLARRFAEAFAADDVATIVTLLTDDAWLTMPPANHEYRGPSAVGRFLRASADWRAERKLLLVPTRANSQPAFACYLPDVGEKTARAAGIVVLTMTPDRIIGITRFLDPHLHRHFGLPGVLDLRQRPTTVTRTAPVLDDLLVIGWPTLRHRGVTGGS